jgi:hypothetical protein
VLRNRDYIVARADGVTTRTIERDQELLDLLAETFGLTVPEGEWLSRVGTAASA